MPTTGGNPATRAYARPMGRATAATDTPATRSLGNHSRRYVRRIRSPGIIPSPPLSPKQHGQEPDDAEDGDQAGGHRRPRARDQRSVLGPEGPHAADMIDGRHGERREPDA